MHIAPSLAGFASVLTAAWLLTLSLTSVTSAGVRREAPSTSADFTAIVTLADVNGVSLYCFARPNLVSADVLMVRHGDLERLQQALGCDATLQAPAAS
jgi:hypothetical protein